MLNYIRINDPRIKNLYNEDTVFHYTKAETAIDFIFYGSKLRFNKGINSSDPIENIITDTRHILPYNSETDTDVYNNLESTTLNLKKNKRNLTQICFCKNTRNDDEIGFYQDAYDFNEELLGFTKLRMWDQYAGNFSGVCIALSKEKMISLNKIKLDLLSGDIKYLNFKELKQNKPIFNQLTSTSKEVLQTNESNLLSNLNKSFFLKHLDYSGENEFRIATLYSKDKCEPEFMKHYELIQENLYLDITECVKAIFVSSFANDKQKNSLYEYSKQIGVELIEMIWKHNSFEMKIISETN